MKRRIVLFGVPVVLAWLSGCEAFHHGLRKEPKEPAMEMTDDSKSSDEESIAPKGMHKSTRLPGAMSDEGAEVESHLGIH
jgi:hypothetical protein